MTPGREAEVSVGRRKRRTRAHVIADLGVNHVERVVLRCGWTVDRVTADYGIDLFVRTYDGAGHVRPDRVPIQVKATDHLSVLKGGGISVRVDRADVRSWTEDRSPFVLIVYDAIGDVAYWLHVQAYFAGRPFGRRGAAESVRVHFDTRQVLDVAAVRSFTSLRNPVPQR